MPKDSHSDRNQAAASFCAFAGHVSYLNTFAEPSPCKPVRATTWLRVLTIEIVGLLSPVAAAGRFLAPPLLLAFPVEAAAAAAGFFFAAGVVFSAFFFLPATSLFAARARSTSAMAVDRASGDLPPFAGVGGSGVSALPGGNPDDVLDNPGEGVLQSPWLS
jgi:hypothetical protein